MKSGVRIIEGITKRDVGREIDLLPSFMDMCGIEYETIDIHGGEKRDEFIGAFDCDRRFVHVSSHGDPEGFMIHGDRGTLVSPRHFEEYCENYRKRPMRKKFLTLSICGTPYLDFIDDLRKHLCFEAVIAPMNDIAFEDSALFFVIFYYQFNRYEYLTGRAKKERILVDFIDAFQKSKMAWLTLGAKGGFRLCYWREGEERPVELI